jgi:hypothetical protein
VIGSGLGGQGLSPSRKVEIFFLTAMFRMAVKWILGAFPL